VMYFSPGNQAELKPLRTTLLNVAIILLVIGNLVLGLFSAGIVDLSDDWTSALTIAQSGETPDAAQVTNP